MRKSLSRALGVSGLVVALVFGPCVLCSTAASNPAAASSQSADYPIGFYAAYGIIAIGLVLYVVGLIGALVRAAQYKEWGWFVAMLITGVAFLIYVFQPEPKPLTVRAFAPLPAGVDPLQAARDLFLREKTASALPYAQQAVQLYPTSVEAWMLLSRLLVKPEDKLGAVERALALAPDSAEVWGYKSRVLVSLRRPQEAREAWERSLAIDSKSVDGHLGEVRYLFILGQAASALPILDEALALGPIPDLYAAKVGALSLLGRNDEAFAVATASTLMFPNSAKAHTELAMACFQLNQYRSGVTEADKALAITSESADAWAARGWNLGGQGFIAEALQAFDRAIALDPTSEAYKVGRQETVEQGRKG
jgi:tetratricopeptide (TPR) repeat protein